VELTLKGGGTFGKKKKRNCDNSYKTKTGRVIHKTVERLLTGIKNSGGCIQRVSEAPTISSIPPSPPLHGEGSQNLRVQIGHPFILSLINLELPFQQKILSLPTCPPIKNKIASEKGPSSPA